MNKINNRLDELLLHVGDMSLKRRAREIINGLNIKDNDTIADLGCGDGYYLYLLKNLPVKVNLIGIDNDPIVIENAKKNLKSFKTNIIYSDLHKIPIKNNFFNKIILTEVLEHVEDDQKVLNEIMRVLKPGGKLILTVPNANYPFFWDPINWLLQRTLNYHFNDGFFSGIWAGHRRLYLENELVNKINKVGFKIDKVQHLTGWCLPFNHYIVNIVARFLYDIKPNASLSDPISKFKESSKPLPIKLAFIFVNLFDKLNDRFPLKNGLNLYVEAIK